MLTSPALSLYMCQNSRSSYLGKLMAVNLPTAESLSADFCYPFKTAVFDLKSPTAEKKSTEINAHTFDDNLVRRIDGPMSEPKRFLRKKESKGKRTCRCNCSSKNDYESEESIQDEIMIQELNRLCKNTIKREQQREDERDAAALLHAASFPPLNTHRDESLIPGDGKDRVIAPWPAGRRVDEDVNGVVGREEGWCLIEHDVKVDGAEDLLEGIKCQTR